MSVTLVTLLARRDGLSRDEFVAHYEANHRRIGERVLAGYATRYVRRYVAPVEGEHQPGEPDVVMEIDFPDRATMQAFFTSVQKSDVAATIAEDEAKLFERSLIRTYIVEEEHSSAI